MKDPARQMGRAGWTTERYSAMGHIGENPRVVEFEPLDVPAPEPASAPVEAPEEVPAGV